MVGRAIRRAEEGALPDFVPPQLTALTETPPEGGEWCHELKWDGYRMHARLDGGQVRLLTRTGLDWTSKYPAIVDALQALSVEQAYLDGELCALSEGGLTSFSAMQAATDARSTDGLVFVLFDLLFVDGIDLTSQALRVRKERLETLLADAPAGLQYSEHHLGSAETFYRHACKLGIEGIVSKRLDCPYKPGDRGIWRKIKCLNREEFVVVGWTDPEGSRPHLGALLLAYYAPDGRLTYAGRAGTGMNTDQLRRLREALGPLATTKMPLDVPPPRGTRFGSPLVLSRVHWVRPEMVAEVTYLTWTTTICSATWSLRPAGGQAGANVVRPDPASGQVSYARTRTSAYLEAGRPRVRDGSAEQGRRRLQRVCLHSSQPAQVWRCEQLRPDLVLNLPFSDLHESAFGRSREGAAKAIRQLSKPGRKQSEPSAGDSLSVTRRLSQSLGFSRGCPCLPASL
jgi:bifunctional non-homologous end joining protein LigD